MSGVPRIVPRKTASQAPPGYILGRRPGTGIGPAEWLDINTLRSMGIASLADAAAGSVEHGFGFSISGRPTAGQIIGIASFPFVMSFFSADPGDSVGSGVAATGTPAFLIQTQVSGIWTTEGTITWSAGGVVGAVAFSPSNPWVLPANQQFRLVAPASQDATLSDISGRVVGTSG